MIFESKAIGESEAQLEGDIESIGELHVEIAVVEERFEKSVIASIRKKLGKLCSFCVHRHGLGVAAKLGFVVALKSK